MVLYGSCIARRGFVVLLLLLCLIVMSGSAFFAYVCAVLHEEGRVCCVLLVLHPLCDIFLCRKMYCLWMFALRKQSECCHMFLFFLCSRVVVVLLFASSFHSSFWCLV